MEASSVGKRNALGCCFRSESQEWITWTKTNVDIDICTRNDNPSKVRLEILQVLFTMDASYLLPALMYTWTSVVRYRTAFQMTPLIYWRSYPCWCLYFFLKGYGVHCWLVSLASAIPAGRGIGKCYWPSSFWQAFFRSLTPPRLLLYSSGRKIPKYSHIYSYPTKAKHRFAKY